MPSVSSLLNSAKSTRKKIAEQQDAQVAYDFSLSAKSYDDFVEYEKYLNSRRPVYADDASKLLTIEKTITAARKAYVSNEIQRQNINIIEGRGDNNTKYEKLVDLFYDAVDNGDYDLAQTLNLQLDNLSVKMQNEAIAAQEKANSAYKAAAAADKKVLTNLKKALEDGPGYVTLPDGNEYRTLASIKKEVQETGGLTLPDGSPDNPITAAKETAEAIANLVIKEYETAEDQDSIDKLEQKYGSGLEDLYKNLTVDFLGQKLNIEDLDAAAVNEEMNNPLYTLQSARNATGALEYKLVKNKINDYRYVRDAQGNYVPLATTAKATSPGETLGAQFTDKGELVDPTTNNIRGGEAIATEKLSIKDRLTNLGYTVRSEEGQDGQIELVTPQGELVTATIQPDGSIRYFGQPNESSGDNPGLYEISLFGKNLGTDARPYNVTPGQVRAVAPDEISDFGEASVFGGQISKASERGENYLDAYRGKLQAIRPQDLRGNISIGNNFSGAGSPITSGVLQNGQFTQRNIRQEKQLKEIQLQAQRDQEQLLQQSQAFNLNQTPVAQFASNGVRINQLKVAPLPAQRISSVSVAKPAQKITSTSVAKPKGKVSVYTGTPKYMTIPGLSF